MLPSRGLTFSDRTKIVVLYGKNYLEVKLLGLGPWSIFLKCVCDKTFCVLFLKQFFKPMSIA